MLDRYALSPMRDLWTEEAKYRRWLRVELTVAEAQAHLGWIPAEVPSRLRERLLPLTAKDIERAKAIEREIGHDVLAFVRMLEEKAGPEGRYLHYGLTSYDVVDTALSLALQDGLTLLIQEVETLTDLLAQQAQRHQHTVMVGRTHGVHAEPITWGLKLLVWYAEWQRHRERLQQAYEMISVGKISGSVGTYAHVPPEVEERVCAALGLRPAPVAHQALARDRHAQVVTTLALMAGTVEKMATEIRNLHRTEIAEVREGRPHGSSSMPHKQNPSLSETLTGLARVVRMHALAALENIAVWHEQDLTRSSVERLIFPDAFLAVHYQLVRLREVLCHLQVNPQAMARNLERTQGAIYSQGLLLRLVAQGVSRAQAHEWLRTLVAQAQQSGQSLLEVVLNDRRISQYLTPEEIREVFSPAYHLKHVPTLFARVLGKFPSRRRSETGTSPPKAHNPGAKTSPCPSVGPNEEGDRLSSSGR